MDGQTKYALVQPYVGTYDDAVSDITRALGEEGFGILTQIDVAATLKKKLDVDYPNYIILGACSPTHAYSALKAQREIGLLLPCNVIVYEDGGTVYIAVMRPTAALSLTGDETIAEIASDVEGKLRRALLRAVKTERNDI